MGPARAESFFSAQCSLKILHLKERNCITNKQVLDTGFGFPSGDKKGIEFALCVPGL